MNEPRQTGDSIADVQQLDRLLSEPTQGVVETMRRLEGDVLVLGVGGKMGPTLARMARRASDIAGVQRRVIGVSRFSTARLQRQLESYGIETIRCDLLDRRRLNELPAVANVIYMAAMKFGATGPEPLTWAMNVYMPGMVCERFCRSRIPLAPLPSRMSLPTPRPRTCVYACAGGCAFSWPKFKWSLCR